MRCCETERSSHRPKPTKQEAETSSQEERRPREGADDGVDCVAGALWPTAISTEPRCTQLTPSSAERARRERRHPKASTAKKSLALDPIREQYSSTSAVCNAQIPATSYAIGAPWSRVSVKPLRTFRGRGRRSTARRGGKDESRWPWKCGSRALFAAPSSVALVLGADRYSGFQAFSVGSTSLRRRPRCSIALGGENSLSNSLVRSGRDRPTVVPAASRHQHEDDARDLVGERHRCQIELVFDRLALEHPARP